MTSGTRVELGRSLIKHPSLECRTTQLPERPSVTFSSGTTSVFYNDSSVVWFRHDRWDVRFDPNVPDTVISAMVYRVLAHDIYRQTAPIEVEPADVPPQREGIYRSLSGRPDVSCRITEWPRKPSTTFTHRGLTVRYQEDANVWVENADWSIRFGASIPDYAINAVINAVIGPPATDAHGFRPPPS